MSIQTVPTYTATLPGETFQENVRRGLTAPVRFLSPIFFYDEKGSQLYEQICNLDAYYPYLAEKQIFQKHASEIYGSLNGMPLVELGSGNSAKVRYLLEQYQQAGKPFSYCPVDISETMLTQTAQALRASFSLITVQTAASDFLADPQIVDRFELEHKAIAYFGSSIGNLSPSMGGHLIKKLYERAHTEDLLLLGVDLEKEPAIMVRAYDDPQGVTAAFNLNLLTRINRELGGHFILNQFHHKAIYNENQHRIEMHLVSNQQQVVAIDGLGMEVTFKQDETIHTESSYKFSEKGLVEMCGHGGLHLQKSWFDPNHYFCLSLFRKQGF